MKALRIGYTAAGEARRVAIHTAHTLTREVSLSVLRFRHPFMVKIDKMYLTLALRAGGYIHPLSLLLTSNAC